MKLSRQIRPISYLKAHAAEIVQKLANNKNQWSSPRMAKPRWSCKTSKATSKPSNHGALEILALGCVQVEEGKVLPAANVLKTSSRTAGDSVMRFKVLLTTMPPVISTSFMITSPCMMRLEKRTTFWNRSKKHSPNCPDSQSGVLTPRNCWR